MTKTKDAPAGERATKRKPAEAVSLSPADAVGVLAAAVSVCLKAGLKVRATNKDGALILAVDGAAVDHTTNPPRLTLAQAAEVTN